MKKQFIQTLVKYFEEHKTQFFLFIQIQRSCRRCFCCFCVITLAIEAAKNVQKILHLPEHRMRKVAHYDGPKLIAFIRLIKKQKQVKKEEQK